MKRMIRPFDILAAAIAIGAVVGVSLFAYNGRVAASEVRIESDEGVFLYTLDQPRELAISGPIGNTLIEIDEGRVRVTESPCRDKICIAAGWLETNGQWAACLPNRVFVRVDGDIRDDEEVDWSVEMLDEFTGVHDIERTSCHELTDVA